MSDIRVWPMDEGGVVVKTDEGVDVAKAAYAKWLRDTEEEGIDLSDSYAARMRAREGWYRWTPCSERSCYDLGNHRPGHLQYESGPGRGVWRGVTLDYP